MTTSNSLDKSRKAQLAPCNTSVQTIINQRDTIMAKQDLITLAADNWIGLERDVQLRMLQLFWVSSKDKWWILSTPNQSGVFRYWTIQLPQSARSHSYL